MAIIRSDLTNFEGRRIIERLLAEQIRTGKKITVSDDILMQYFMSLHVTEQYPNKIQTAANQEKPNDYLLGMFANVTT